MKRVFDLIFAIVGILFFLPFLVLIALLIVIDGKGGILYKQERVGKDGHVFKVFKFRTMKPDSFGKGALTVGSRDPRITKVGYYLRKYKLDELPQLFNVLFGQMSFVGPRPEVKKYTDLYTLEQRKVLLVKPGITDYASIKFRNESDLLSASNNPEKFYVEQIMPEKISLNMEYIQDNNILKDVKIILNTFYAIVKE